MVMDESACEYDGSAGEHPMGALAVAKRKTKAHQASAWQAMKADGLSDQPISCDARRAD